MHGQFDHERERAERVFQKKNTRSMPTANAEGPAPIRKGTLKARRPTQAFRTPPSDAIQPWAFAVGMPRKVAKKKRSVLGPMATYCLVMLYHSPMWKARARTPFALGFLYSYGLYSYCPYRYGLYGPDSYGPYNYGPCSHACMVYIVMVCIVMVSRCLVMLCHSPMWKARARSPFCSRLPI